MEANLESIVRWPATALQRTKWLAKRQTKQPTKRRIRQQIGRPNCQTVKRLTAFWRSAVEIQKMYRYYAPPGIRPGTVSRPITGWFILHDSCSSHVLTIPNFAFFAASLKFLKFSRTRRQYLQVVLSSTIEDFDYLSWRYYLSLRTLFTSYSRLIDWETFETRTSCRYALERREPQRTWMPATG